jgi:mRNA turnover protein 4
MDQIRSCLQDPLQQHIYLFKVRNMRNGLFKNVRAAVPGRFFIGKNKVMALALGLDESSEALPNLSQLARQLRGDPGLLFTSETPETVQRLLLDQSAEDYARTGNRASMTVVIEADPAGLRNVDTNEPLPATVEGQLRAAGMPTKLRGGLILLAAAGDSYTVCTEGDRLTANQARILKIFGIKMATFCVNLMAHYHDGTYEEYKINHDVDDVDESAQDENEDGAPMDDDEAEN